MDELGEDKPLAWQPFTPKGVAAFAYATFGRVFLVQLLVSLLAAGTVDWVLYAAWFPVIQTAIDHLPQQGVLHHGQLDFPAESPQRLAENRFLAITVDLDHSGDVRSPAHIQVELGRSDLELFSLLGFVQVPYPRDWQVPVNRTELIPWWGAWAPPILGIAALGVIASLMVVWGCLATIYCPAVWLVGFFANRDLSLAGSWRLASVSLMPAAVLIVLGILAYGLGLLELPGMAVVLAAHFLAQWFCLLASTLVLPRHPAVAENKANPFAAPPPSQPED
jgi:hypothetical protein